MTGQFRVACVTGHQRSFSIALAISVVSHTAAFSLLAIVLDIDDAALPSPALEVVLMPQPPAEALQAPSPEKLEQRTARELSASSQRELRTESAAKSMPTRESKPLPAFADNAPPADASPRPQQQPTAKAPTTPAASRSGVVAAPAPRQAAGDDSSVFPSSAPEGIYLPARVTYQDLHKNDPVTSVGPVFPTSAPEGIYLPARVTYQDLHRNDPVTSVGPVFPSSAPERYALPPKVTYADLVGKKKAEEACAACHGPDGGNQATPDTPRLAGLRYDYLVQALIEYRKDARDNAVMTAVAKSLTEKEIRDLAWYFSRRPGSSTTR